MKEVEKELKETDEKLLRSRRSLKEIKNNIRKFEKYWIDEVEIKMKGSLEGIEGEIHVGTLENIEEINCIHIWEKLKKVEEKLGRKMLDWSENYYYSVESKLKMRIRELRNITAV